jgi:hypothetical protein
MGRGCALRWTSNRHTAAPARVRGERDAPLSRSLVLDSEATRRAESSRVVVFSSRSSFYPAQVLSQDRRPRLDERLSRTSLSQERRPGSEARIGRTAHACTPRCTAPPRAQDEMMPMQDSAEATATSLRAAAEPLGRSCRRRPGAVSAREAALQAVPSRRGRDHLRLPRAAKGRTRSQARHRGPAMLAALPCSASHALRIAQRSVQRVSLCPAKRMDDAGQPVLAPEATVRSAGTAAQQ